MNEIPNPFQLIMDKLEHIDLKLEVINKRLDLLSRSSKGSEDNYKSVQEIAQMFGVKPKTINQQLVDNSMEIQVLQNGSRGKKLVNFTHYQKVFGNQITN